ncbi:MAG: Nif3-like dinuclear metal center hexameric protein [Bacteroidota bacterium]
MPKINEITSVIEKFAPLPLQESYDNAGLIVGDRNMEVTGALICLDSTEDVVDEAIEMGFNLIIAHHPIVFSGLKKINGNNYIERVIIKAIKNNIAIYAAHTNLDNVKQGVNAKICEKIGLKDVRILAPIKGNLRKLVTFCKSDHAEEIRQALFNAGGGVIGNYDECSFSALGYGTFRGGEGTNPFVGEKGVQAREEEVRIETVFPAYLASKMVKALMAAHPYEEVAYDIYPLEIENPNTGAGMIGTIDSIDEMEFLSSLKDKMQTDCIRHTKTLGRRIKTVAVCGGAGSFLLRDAIRAEADVFITGDFKYHQFFDAEGRIIIADIGHYESEQFTKEILYYILTTNFSTFAARISNINTNPIKYL